MQKMRQSSIQASSDDRGSQQMVDNDAKSHHLPKSLPCCSGNCKSCFRPWRLHDFVLAAHIRVRARRQVVGGLAGQSAQVLRANLRTRIPHKAAIIVFPSNHSVVLPLGTPAGYPQAARRLQVNFYVIQVQCEKPGSLMDVPKQPPMTCQIDSRAYTDEKRSYHELQCR